MSKKQADSPEKKSSYQITFEWNDSDFYQDGTQTISRLPTPDVVAEKSETAMRATMAAIQDVGERVATTMNSMVYPPTSVEIEFGIRLGAESGVITKNNEEAHIVVRLIWNHEEKSHNHDHRS
jgi:hypothetical protein